MNPAGVVVADTVMVAVASALETAQQHPAGQQRVAGLAAALERVVALDAAFAAELRALWPRASAELSASEGGTVNVSTGTVGGHLVQARDVHVDGGRRS